MLITRFLQLLDGLRAINLLGVLVFFRKGPFALREYLSGNVQRYDASVGVGLPVLDPVAMMVDAGWVDASETITSTYSIPMAVAKDTGGTQLVEFLHLAATTRALQPKTMFEIGTFQGMTTVVLASNSEGRVWTLDLPPEDSEKDELTDYISSDVDLVRRRVIGKWIPEFFPDNDLERGPIIQLFGDSMKFDPSPYEDSIELGFIDAAHAVPFVRNDSQKMARMVREERSIVLWHDYGGKGAFRPLSQYLETLHSKETPLYRVPNTSLAWTTGAVLKTLEREGRF